MQIRRDRSALHFGRRARRRGPSWFFGFWFFSMAAAVGVIWQFNRVQPEVLAVVMGPPTPTTDAVTLAQLAEEAYWQGDLDNSILYYSQAYEMTPEDMGIMFEYVRNLVYGSYDGRGFGFRADRALEVAQAAVDNFPNDPRALAAYTLALVSKDRGEEAASAGIKAVDRAPDWAEPLAYLSMAYREQERWLNAQETAQKAVDLNPNSVDARRSLALAMAFTGQFDIAISQYEQAIQAQPRLNVLYFELAPYYIVKGNFDAAIQAYDRVLANDSHNVKAWTRKCETFFQERNDISARESCEQAVELDPTYPDAWKQLGMVQYTSRNYEGSIESFQICVQLMTDGGWKLEDQLGECYTYQGLAYQLLAQCHLAMPVFEIALQTNPGQTLLNYIYIGMDYCIKGDSNYSGYQVPTAVPPTPIPPEPIGIY
ncbi:MAG: tetratricopeptide repeat protein [Chloroflexi bacterium]|nr:tetratricopeptide repeat protein [Chloroflexota bacterium]